MNTIELPAHTRARLLTHGSAIDLSPMEPQPPEKSEWISDARDGLQGYWRTRLKKNGPYAYASAVPQPPHKPGDVVALAEPFYVQPFIWADFKGVQPVEYSEVPAEQLEDYELHPASEMPAWAARHHARCESVTPLRLADLTSGMIVDVGFPWTLGGPKLAAMVWWNETHPQYPWQTSWAWMRRWVLEKGA